MKKIILFFLLAEGALSVTAQDAASNFKQLLSLKGLWTMETKRGPLFESWKQADDSSLTGKSYRVINGDTSVLEEVSILIKGNNLFYAATVAEENNPLVVFFKLIKTANETFVFDNPDHDFPQRVIYQLPKNDALHAWIEGMDKGIYRKSDFVYKKVK